VVALEAHHGAIGGRILVAGSSGAGKTTMARRLAALLDLPYVEVDGLFHGPGWTERPEFVEDMTSFLAQPVWVIDADYAQAREAVWARIDTLVWLDYPRWLTEARVLRRSIARGLLRRTLWNGNTEDIRRMLTDPDHPVRSSWRNHSAKRERYRAMTTAPEHAHVHVVHLERPRDARRWLRGLPAAEAEGDARPR
jgi:adenylate kinase family enzyme